MKEKQTYKYLLFSYWISITPTDISIYIQCFCILVKCALCMYTNKQIIICVMQWNGNIPGKNTHSNFIHFNTFWDRENTKNLTVACDVCYLVDAFVIATIFILNKWFGWVFVSSWFVMLHRRAMKEFNFSQN